MKKVRAFHPVFFAAFPILAVFAANAALFPLAQLARPLLSTICVTIAVWLVIGVILRDWNRSALAASVLVLSAFSFEWVWGRLVDDGMTTRLITGWAIVSILLAALAAWKFRWHRFANILSVFLCLVSGGSIAVSSVRKVSLAHKPSGEAGARAEALPDILYVVLDGYGRTDQLKRAIGYDNGWFMDELERRGFYVASKSHSNYSQTDLSLSSTLNLATIQELFPEPDLESNDRLALYRLIDQNEVADRLRREGYAYVGVRSGYPGIRFDTADYVPESGPRTTLFEATILQLTPLRTSKKTVASMFDSRREDLLQAVRHLNELSQPTRQPRFILAHVLAPHPPFVLGPNGEALRPSGMYGFFDGSHYLSIVGSVDDYRKGYAGQAEFIAKEVLSIVDAFISNANVRPIIVIQSDHGSKVGLDQGSLDNSDLDECFAILSAFYVPEQIRASLYPEITSINTFRLLLSGLFGHDLRLLPDRSYYSPSDTPFQLSEVTNMLQRSGEEKDPKEHVRLLPTPIK